jgi:hypothetical protein
MTPRLAELIREAYSQAAADEYEQFAVTRSQREQLGALGWDILSEWRGPRAYACVPMTALWVWIAREELALPAYFVAGDLLVDGEPSFGSNADSKQVAEVFNQSNLEWDGHAWLVIGEHVGDISVFRTAYGRPAESRLRQAIEQRFGTGRGLLLARTADWDSNGLSHHAKWVLTPQQLEAVVRGAFLLHDHGASD